MLIPLKTIGSSPWLPGLIGITLLSLLGQFSRVPYLELFAHFQPQYTILCLGFTLAILGSTWMTGDLTRPLIGIVLLCFSLNAASIVPWYIPAQNSTIAHQTPLRVLVVNVNGRNHQYQRVVSMVETEQPDIAIFIEVNTAWSDQLQPLKSHFPYQVGDQDSPIQGIIIYSQFPLENSRIESWGMTRNPSIITDVIVQDQRLSLIAAHPLPPVKSAHFYSRNQQLEAIAHLITSLDTPVILAGDLNITPWSSYYRQLIHQTGLHNARQGFGLLSTWSVHPRYQGLPRWLRPLFWIPIDHCLVSPTLQVRKSHTGPYVGSDHLPLITDLTLPTNT